MAYIAFEPRGHILHLQNFEGFPKKVSNQNLWIPVLISLGRLQIGQDELGGRGIPTTSHHSLKGIRKRGILCLTSLDLNSPFVMAGFEGFRKINLNLIITYFWKGSNGGR